jgi:hypothetical protein
VGAKEQLAKLFSSYGTVADVHALDDYPSENFTEVYLVKYKRIQSARYVVGWSPSACCSMCGQSMGIINFIFSADIFHHV